MNWQAEYDVVVVGSGAVGIVSAITAVHNGLITLIIEKGEFWGGSSTLSGGGLWIPNNYVSKKAGLEITKTSKKAAKLPTTSFSPY